MISKETAEALARALLEPAQSELHERSNARVRYVSLFYRFPELKRFEPWQRDSITRRCVALVNHELLTIVLLAVWLVFVVAASGFFLPVRLFGVGHAPVMLVIGLFLILLHIVRVRRHVRAFVDFVEQRERHSEDAG